MAGALVTVPPMLDPLIRRVDVHPHRFRGGRRDYQDSRRSDDGYTGNTNDLTAPDARWGDWTNNDQTWDTAPGKNVDAAWGLAPESKIEKPRPEERKQPALPHEGNAWDAPRPLGASGNPYRPVGTRKGDDRAHTPSSNTDSGASWTAKGDASWGTGTRTKKILDSEQTEGMARRVLGERVHKDVPRCECCLFGLRVTNTPLRSPRQGLQPAQVEEPTDEEDGGDGEGDLTPPPMTPTTPHTRRSTPYSYVSTLTATTLDTGYISSGTVTMTGRGLTKVVGSGLPQVSQARSSPGSVVGGARKGVGRIVYEDGLEYEEECEYIYEGGRRGREVVLRSAAPTTKQRVVYQPVHPQYLYVYEGDEEYDDSAGVSDLYYAPPQASQVLVRRPAQPKSVSFRVPNSNTDVTITLNEAGPPPVRYTFARPRTRSAERVLYEPARRARTGAPRIYEVDTDGYAIARDEEYEEVPVTSKAVPKGRAYVRE
jgi:hypothetical protein